MDKKVGSLFYRRLFSLFSVNFFILVATGVVYYFMSHYHHADYPYSTPMATPHDNYLSDQYEEHFGYHLFGDYKFVYEGTNSPNPYQPDSFFRSNYFPFAHLLIKVFSKLPYHISFYIFFSVVFAFQFI